VADWNIRAGGGMRFDCYTAESDQAALFVDFDLSALG
jgi:hypothetical protein